MSLYYSPCIRFTFFTVVFHKEKLRHAFESQKSNTINKALSDTTIMVELKDSELDDLISSDTGDKGTSNNSNSNSNSIADSPQMQYSSYYQFQRPTLSSFWLIPQLCIYMCMSFLLKYPGVAKVTTTILFLSLLYFLLSVTNQGKTEEIGRIRYDFTKIHSQYDFDIGQIDHWCIDVSF